MPIPKAFEFPGDFVERVKAEFPNESVLHRWLDEGKVEMVVAALRNRLLEQAPLEANSQRERRHSRNELYSEATGYLDNCCQKGGLATA